ncbi:long-chain fatty acid--CoA ligase [Magnetospirillum gryphiswaldense]|uniref:AMP-dependent synthetase and ligase n=1 Tax=Magnetospirillum gryphiswaldense TaxID=55518 RepID=A4TXS6_9PROT|nr:long-chain fatty acid--CoA ligase [Magnetospirillum gryphiswaldense]AVM74487.1 Long-chain-fatty-acid--CoA ligase FadD15 [Magnetospirillum gryphiswaldense MSR-1]AVM78390.1 Long-chain-fatty-acid--CoA ligase FadD15 [Magnetospirillum gryphiswaldense]CAM75433.1 AMP-dependent synthetase and ligase [Magnetospirillum gryphiswaldense MSR-1]
MSHDYNDTAKFDTFPKLLCENARRWPNDVAMREKEFGIWNLFTWTDYLNEVRRLALGLAATGVKRGDVVAILGKNRPEWVWGELAAHSIGALSMGVYQDSMNAEVAYLLNYTAATVVLAEDEEQVDKLLEIAPEVPSLRYIVYFDPRGMRKYQDDKLIFAGDLRAKGDELAAREPGRFEAEVNEGKGDDVSVLVTTSGTTSNPKLAMLQSGPFLRHCTAYLRADEKSAGENYVSMLPLPWIMEQIYAVGQPLVCRNIVNFVEEPETQMPDMREIGPHFVLLAPRTWEAIAAEVRSRMMDSTRFKRFMFDLGMKLGMQALDQGKRSWLADRILFKALRDRIGFSYLKSAATGGAALGPDTFRFFLAMGVPLRQIYGQTELAGAYTVHRGHDIDFDSVGIPFDDAQLRIDNPDHNGVGEIVAHTDGMFTGYYKNPEASKADIVDGNWLKTGDAGYIKKENGHLVVIDRIKDLATTTHGVRFSPQFIENKLKFSPFIAEAVILGAEKPYLSALVCIRYSIVSKWAEQKGIAFTNYTNLSAQEQVYELLRSEVEKVNATLPEPQRIRKFLLLYKELDADDGELTRTRKVRRGVINDKYGDIIDDMYANRPMVPVDAVITFQDGSTTRVKTELKVITLLPPPTVAQAAE